MRKFTFSITAEVEVEAVSEEVARETFWVATDQVQHFGDIIKNIDVTYSDVTFVGVED